MFNKDTRTILGTLTGITDSFIFETPKTVFTDEYKQMIVSLDTEKLGENFKEPIGIAKTSNLLKAIDLIPEANIELNGKFINISNKNSKINYLVSDLKSMDKTDYKIIDSTKKVDTILGFNFNKELIDQIRKASSVFPDANTLFIENKDKLKLTIGMDETFNAASNTYEIEIEDFTSDKEFEIKLPLDNFLKIPSMTYTFEVKYNKEKDAYRVILHNSLIEIVMSIIK